MEAMKLTCSMVECTMKQKYGGKTIDETRQDLIDEEKAMYDQR